MRVLVLSKKSYPEAFNSHPIRQNDSSFNVENKIIEKMNEYNSKLDLRAIIYKNIKEDFSIINSGKFFGLILDISILKNIENVEDNLVEIEGIEYNYNIFAYVFMSSNEENTRNALFSQQIFPELIEIISRSQEKQTFMFADKPIYLINLINKKMTAPFISQELEMMLLAGIEIVNVFETSLEKHELSTSLDAFINKIQESKLRKLFDYYKDKNKIILRIENLEDGIERKSTGYAFKGSSEKFFWLGALCIFKFAFDLGMSLDVSEIEEFRLKYALEIKNSSKFARTNILFRYLEKLSKGRRYFNV